MNGTRGRHDSWSVAAALAPLVPDVSADARPFGSHVDRLERARVRGR